MKSNLRALADLISQSVDTIEAIYEGRGHPLPSLDDPFVPEAEGAPSDPETEKTLAKASALICSAAYELGLLVRPPHATVLMQTGGFLKSAALRSALELHVVEILKPAGKAGLHANKIAAHAHADTNKLSRILRFLATHGIFKEVSPDVFANNRLSSIMDKGYDAETLLGNPEKTYDNPQSSFSALIGHIMDDSAKAAAYLYETLADPKAAFSGDPTDCAFTKAHNSNLTLWDYYELPENQHRLKRFGVAMQASARVDPVENLLKKYDWTSLPEGAKVVDVGGGVGTVSVLLAKAQPKLKLIVQDRAPVVADGEKRWSETHADIISSGQVTFQAHDFFEEQPIKDADIFFAKAITHDWSDAYAAKILYRLRDAAQPHTKLLVMDRIIPYACRTTEVDIPSVPGLIKEPIPDPLPANMGAGSPTSYSTDLNMLVLVNGQERTIGHFVDLFQASRWKLIRVYQVNSFGRFASLLEAIPA